MQDLPFYVYLVFGITVLSTICLLFKASHYCKPFLVVILSWLSLQSGLGILGFYHHPDSMTQKFPLLFLPALIFLLFRLTTNKGKAFMDNLDLPTLTLISTIRMPVELVLYWLLLNKSIPEAMTFHGRNFDLFLGITAPIVYYFGFVKKTMGYKVMLIWNILCLLLLVNVVSNALLALPDRYLQFKYEQPNIGLGYFPFNLPPAFLVPTVLFSMVGSIRLLYHGIKNTKKYNYEF